MNLIIPFEGKVKFNSPVKEICSISLEHEITKNDHEVLGNFLVSGTYREHELSINTLDFKYTVPFNVDFEARVDANTLEFSIDNFTYDLEDDTLVLKIDYVLTGDEVREEETTFQDPYELLEIDAVAEEPLKEEREEDVEITSEITENQTRLPVFDEPIIAPTEEISEPIEVVEPSLITGIDAVDDYMIYHVHIVQANETLETIALNYKITKDDITRFNDIETLAKGDKLIIPINNE